MKLYIGRGLVVGCPPRISSASGDWGWLCDLCRTGINRLNHLAPYMVATGDDAGCVKIWDIRMAQAVTEFKTHEDYVADMVFDPERHTLISVRYNGRAARHSCRHSCTLIAVHLCVLVYAVEMQPWQRMTSGNTLLRDGRMNRRTSYTVYVLLSTAGSWCADHRMACCLYFTGAGGEIARIAFPVTQTPLMRWSKSTRAPLRRARAMG